MKEKPPINPNDDQKPICIYCKKRISYSEYRVEYCEQSPTKMHETS